MKIYRLQMEIVETVSKLLIKFLKNAKKTWQTKELKAYFNALKSKPPNESGQMLPFHRNKWIERNENFINEIQASPPKSVFASKKTDAIYRYDTWSTELVDLNEFRKNLKAIPVFQKSSIPFVSFDAL